MPSSQIAIVALLLVVPCLGNGPGHVRSEHKNKGVDGESLGFLPDNREQPHPSRELVWIKNPANGLEYALTTVQGSWVAAQAEAEAMGGNLATVRNSKENDWLLDRFGQENLWISLFQDETDPSYSEPGGGWKWASGESAGFRNWGSGQPDENEPGENWAILKCTTCFDAGRWHDQGNDPATDSFRGIIERHKPCLADTVPDGQLDFSDVIAFLGAFQICLPMADLAPPFGVCDFSDVVEFLVQFAAGCP